MSAEQTTRYSAESLLSRPVAAYLRARGYDYVAREIPFYDRSIDLYAFCEETNWSLAVELKLTRWRKAFTQALLYQLCADVAVVALPAREAARVDMQALAEHGVGLLAVLNDGSCEERLAPRPPGVLRDDYKTECKLLMRRKSRWRR